MTLADLVVTGSRAVLPDGIRPASVVITGGVIRDVVEDGAVPPAREQVDVGNAVLLPGLVDTHVHVNEPGRTEWEGFATATRAAAAGGVTTLVDMPLNSVPVTTSVAALEAKAAAAAGHAMVDYGFWGGVVPANAEQLAPLLAAGVLGFKCFLVPSGIPEFAPVATEDLRVAMERLAGLDTVLLAHAEARGPIDRAAVRLQGAPPARYATYLASRPPGAEHEAIELLLALAATTGCGVHIVHLSAADALPAIARARAERVPVSVETCPHYLTFAAEEVPDGATAYKCAPPIRDGANRESLWRALAAGQIDLVASDHSPAPPERKAGDFLTAWGGIASLELSLGATWSGARARGHDARDVARWMCEAPARLAGLAHRKGRIAEGLDADLVVWEPEATCTVDAARLEQRHKLTPYEGMTLWGAVRQTYVRGRLVFDRGGFPAPPAGTWLRRRAP